MMKQITPGSVSGSLAAPPSKSYTHRAIICASLARGVSRISNFLESRDTDATIGAAQALGARIVKKGGALEISGGFPAATQSEINCLESGSTARFFLAIAPLAEGPTTITGKGSLMGRPMQPIIDALAPLGVRMEAKNGCLPIKISGRFDGGVVRIRGDISSQFISGLMLAAPLARNETQIHVKGGFESKPYVGITIDVMRKFGVDVRHNNQFTLFEIKGSSQYSAKKYMVEGDFSSAAFLLAAGAIAGEVKVTNLNPKSVQGDREIVKILKKMGCGISIDRKNGSITARKGEMRGMRIDAHDITDLVPILAVLGCFARKETLIFNAERARIKESDRIASIASELKKMGARIEERKNGLLVKESRLKGAEIDPHGDHRIAMACAIAGLCAEGKTVIRDAECVSKSYPRFFEDLRRLVK